MINKAATVLLSTVIVSMGISTPLLTFADIDSSAKGDTGITNPVQTAASEKGKSADTTKKNTSTKESKKSTKSTKKSKKSTAKKSTKSTKKKTTKSTVGKSTKSSSKTGSLRKIVKIATKKVIEPVKDNTEKSSSSVSANIVIGQDALANTMRSVSGSSHKFDPSASASGDINVLVKAKILKNDIYKKSFAGEIGADELNGAMTALYKFLGGKKGEDSQPGRVEEIYDPVSGKSTLPAAVERGEAIGTLVSTATSAYADRWESVRDEFFSFISDNSIGAIKDAYKQNENEEHEINMNREEMFMLISQFVWKFEKEKITEAVPAPDTPQTLNVSGEEFYKKDVYLYWASQGQASSYIVRIYDEKGKMTKKVRVKDNFLNITASSKPSFKEVFGSKRVDHVASYTVQAVSGHGLKSQQSEPVSFTALKYDSVAGRFGSTHLTYKNGNEGSVDQAVVAVPVWHDANGTRVPATATFSVNKKVAVGIQEVFGEYFNGSERFPIQSIGGFSHREKRSEHNYGTAIDINPNENFMVGPSGITCGSFWDPEKSTYSIPADSDLVKAFERHGWYWAGNGWGSTYDYMHFSYQGT